jgi:hypothetical protein
MAQSSTDGIFVDGQAKIVEDFSWGFVLYRGPANAEFLPEFQDRNESRQRKEWPEGDNSTVMIAYVRALGPGMVIQFLEAQNSTNLGFLPISTEEKSSNNYVERHSTVAAASAIS